MKVANTAPMRTKAKMESFIFLVSCGRENSMFRNGFGLSGTWIDVPYLMYT